MRYRDQNMGDVMALAFYDESGQKVIINDATTFNSMVAAGKIKADTILIDERNNIRLRASECEIWPSALSANVWQSFGAVPSYGAVGADRWQNPPEPPFNNSTLFNYGCEEEPQSKLLPTMIASAAMLLMAVLLSVFSSRYFAYSSRQFSANLARFFVIALLSGITAFFILRFAFKVHSRLGLFIFSVIALSFSLYHSGSLLIKHKSARSPEKQKRVLEDMVAMFRSIDSKGNLPQQEFDERRYGDYAPAMKIGGDFVAALKQDFDDLDKQFESLSLDRLLSAETFRSADSIDEAQQNLQKAFEILDRTEETLESRIEGVQAAINGSELPESFKRAFLAGFNQSKELWMGKLRELLDLARIMYSKADDALNFMRDARGRYKVSGGKVVFFSGKDINTFNRHLRDIVGLFRRALEIQIEISQSHREKLDEAESIIKRW
jgi:hypothetical protein